MFPLCRYMCSLTFFHYSEYLVTAIINPHSLSLDSFLLNHSIEYTVAALSSWMEFTVEKLLVPGLFAYSHIKLHHRCAFHNRQTSESYSLHFWTDVGPNLKESPKLKGRLTLPMHPMDAFQKHVTVCDVRNPPQTFCSSLFYPWTFCT